MPTDSLESAQAWHRRNIRPQRRKIKRRPSPSGTPTPRDTVTAAVAATTLDELAELRAIAKRGLADAQAAGDDYSLRAWTLAQAKILDQSAQTEERLLAIAQGKKELLSLAEAHEVFSKVLVDVRKLIDAAPSALAGRVNPSDPQHALEILTDWQRGVLATLHRGAESAPRP